ncbi:MAG: amidohydrolase family protein [Desulfomonilaceae bacterium]|nr:amidohydrolase family protein [Desulfomonilaceae bacterium]
MGDRLLATSTVEGMPSGHGARRTYEVMIIDSHVHLLPRRVQHDRTPFCRSDSAFGSIYSSSKAKLVSETDILHYMDRYGIEKAIVFGFPWEDPGLVRENNDEIWSFHQKHPERIIPFAVLTSGQREPSLKEAARTLEGGFAGFGELAMYHHGWRLADFEALSPSLQLAQMKRVPVIIHVNEPVGHHYPGKIPVDFRGLLRIIKAHAEVDFILAHFGGGIFVYALMPEVAKILSRTYLDTAASPYLYDPKVFRVAADIMGVDKILFGSDYPLLPLSRYVKQLEEAGIDGDMRERILGRNLADLLKLGKDNDTSGLVLGTDFGRSPSEAVECREDS